MMPGETQPAAPGPARCQGCASLQQNLNEYVEALITLKQKIINTDNLLTEYQKKCDELQFARRENSTLHHQVEQMLQKISPLQKCQEELGSLRAELEEKKSSLKLYQDTHQEYARVKEECLKSDAQKKKLEAKVKKLEEAAMRQTQDFKQLRNEKKILEKEFKKTQERLDEFSKHKNERELRHIGTQISSDSYGSIDKRMDLVLATEDAFWSGKVKVLLKELWLCVNSAHRLPGEGSGHAPENPAKENAICGTLGEDGALRPAQGSPPRTWGVQACPTVLSVEGEGPCASCESAEEEQSSEGGTHSPQCAAHEQRCSAPVEPQPGPMDDFASCGHSVDEDLQAAINFFKLPPPLLSPVPSPPLVPPRLSSSSSPLVPETYFGEYMDSSDNDSAPRGSTAESASEDEAAESQDYFGLLGKSEGSRTWAVGKPKSQNTVRAPHRSSAHTVPPSRTEPFVAVPKEPFTTLSLARGGHWIASPRFVNERETLNVAASQVDVRKPGSCAQAGDTLHRPTTNLWVETPSVSLAQEKDIGPEESEPLSSPLVTRTLSELRGAQGKPPASNMERFPQPGFTTCSLTGVPSESDQVTGAGCFQRSRERAKERGAVRGSMLGPPEPDSPTPGAVTEAAGLDGKGGFSPSSPSASLCRNPQSSWLKCVGSAHTPGEVFPREVCHTEQLQMKTLDAFLLQAEPPEGSVQERNPGRSSHAWSSVLGAPGFNDEQSRKTESASALKGVTKTNSCPQSVFQKVTKDGRCESRDPVPGFSLRQSGFTAVTCSPTGSVTSGSASVKSSSWHHSDVLRRGGQESSIATSECEQKGRLQPGMAVLASEGGGLTAVPEHPGGSASRPLAFKASAALLPNQVSVITKQTRPEKAQGAILEPGRPRGNEPTLAVESCVSNTDGLSSGARRARDVQEAAVVESPSPEVSTSWRKLDFDFPGGSLPAESFDCSTDSRLSFSSEHSPTPSQDTDSEPVLQAELQKPPQSPRASKLGPGKVEGEERLAAQVTESCRDAGQAGTEGPMMTSDAPSSPQRAGEACPESLAATHPAHSSALGSPDEETQDVPHSSLSAAAWCYTGPREQGGEDTEVEESEAFSCSEGEHEQEVEIAQQPAVGDSERRVGPSKAEAAEARPCADVGFLTSALKDFNISPFPDLDRLSTSEVVMFLQSCQLRDYSSGDSVSECSSRGTLSKEWKQSAALLGHLGKQLCEEETLGTSEEWVEAEDDDYSESLSQRAPCSLETLSKVLTKLGQELRAHHEDCGSEDADNPVVLKKRSSPAADGLETVPLEETPAPAPRTPELPQPAHGDGTGSAPPRGGSDPEHIQSSLKEESDVTKLSSSREGGLTEPGPPSALSPHREAPLRTEQSRSCVAESAAFQYRISTVTSEVINVRINKDQNVVIEKGDNWTIISGVAISPGMEQVVLCDTLGDGPTSQYQGTLDTGSSSLMSEEKPMEASYDGAPLPEPPRGSSLPGSQEDVSSSGQSTNFDKSRLRSRPVKPSIWVSSQIYDQIGEPESVVAFDHTYCNWKLESVGRSKNRSKISNKDQSPKPGKTWGLSRDDARQGEVPQLSGARESTKPLRTQAQPIVASADTSTPTDCSPDTLSKIRQEVGPPLPPLLAPLIATPPRSSRPMSPVTSSSSPSPASPPGHISPSGLSSWPDKAQQAASPGPSPAPSPSTAVAAGRIVSSPLQFCSATPKHALPVPGRLPPHAPGRAVGGGTQENSVRILDTMYPELSARARTLNLLKGSLQLSRGSCSDGKVLIGFKAITSTSTAFVKTRSGSGGDGSQERSRDVGAQQGMSAKRTLSVSMLRSAKRLRLDSESPEPESRAVPAGVHKNLPGTVPPAEAVTAQEEQSASPGGSPASPPPGDPKETVESPEEAIARALRKIAEAAFDLLPVIRSHVYVGNISKKPVMRDQEKEVVYEFSTAKKHLAECLLRSILSELKLQKTAEDHSYLHALCRVYVGICRQLGDLERARLFCYSVLKEDFPESEKLALFIANTWLDVFLSQSVISQAMQLVARHRARGEVQNCLRAFLCWEKSAPVDVGIMVSKLLLTIQLCPKTEFQSSEKFGEDLSDSIWEYVFAIDLLCCHQKWVWTHDHVISKELWPVMDKWIKFRKGHVNITYTPDVIVASILRLIGRLGQLGLKEGFPTAVRNISSVIGMFIQHARDEDIPWGIQLAAVYALCDLSPSNPAEISKILEAWRRETSNSVPCAIINCLEEVDSLSTGSSDP